VAVGGASSGRHLALLAAFAPYRPEMTPDDLKGCDLSVRAVISEYGPTNLAACYFHTNQNKTTRGPGLLVCHRQVFSQADSARPRLNWVSYRWA